MDLKRYGPFFVGVALLYVGIAFATAALADHPVVRSLKDWQPLFAALLALIAAFIAVTQADRHAEDERKRNVAAARAELPLVLSSICGYAENCAAILRDLVDKSLDLDYFVRVPSTQFFPGPPEAAMAAVREFVRVADPSNARMASLLLGRIQIQSARLRDIGKYMSDGQVPKRNIHDFVLDAAEVYACASAFFRYARGETEDAPSPPDEDSIGSALANMGYFRGVYPEIEEVMRRRWAGAPDV